MGVHNCQFRREVAADSIVDKKCNYFDFHFN